MGFRSSMHKCAYAQRVPYLTSWELNEAKGKTESCCLSFLKRDPTNGDLYHASFVIGIGATTCRSVYPSRPPSLLEPHSLTGHFWRPVVNHDKHGHGWNILRLREADKTFDYFFLKENYQRSRRHLTLVTYYTILLLLLFIILEEFLSILRVAGIGV